MICKVKWTTVVRNVLWFQSRAQQQWDFFCLMMFVLTPTLMSCPFVWVCPFIPIHCHFWCIHCFFCRRCCCSAGKKWAHTCTLKNHCDTMLKNCSVQQWHPAAQQSSKLLTSWSAEPNCISLCVSNVMSMPWKHSQCDPFKPSRNKDECCHRFQFD